MTAHVEIQRNGSDVNLEVEATVEWSGRGRFARVHNIEIDSAKCACGHEVTLTREEEDLCIDAVREQAEIEHGEAMIDEEVA
jgi:hypothetical protein